MDCIEWIYWGREGKPFFRKVFPPFPKPHPSLSKDFHAYRIPYLGFPLRLYAGKSRFPYPVSKKYTSLTYTLTIEPCRNAEQGLGNVKSLWEGWGWLGGGGEDFF